MRTLKVVSEELQAKNGVLDKVFEEAGPEIDFEKVKSLGDGLSTKAKAEKVKALNDELTALGVERDALAEQQRIADETKARGRQIEQDAKNLRSLPHPGNNGDSRKPNGNGQAKSIGEIFTGSAAFKEYNRAQRRGPGVELDLEEFGIKTLLDRTGWVPEATRIGVVLPGLLRRPVVADLIPQGTTSTTTIKYMEETTTTNAAAAVAEGAAKPESALAFTERTSLVEKIATVLPVTDELMDDEPAMRSYVEARLRLFLQLAEETALISGSGTTPALRGMLNVVGINTQAKGADPTPDAVYKGMTKIRTTSFLEPDGAIFHPNDWEAIRLLRTADGIYIWGSPADVGPERIWGLNIVQTTAMTENTAIVAAFGTSMMIFRRNQVTFAVSDQHSDFFIYNKLMLRVEERLAFVVFRPKGIATITGI